MLVRSFLMCFFFNFFVILFNRNLFMSVLMLEIVFSTRWFLIRFCAKLYVWICLFWLFVLINEFCSLFCFFVIFLCFKLYNCVLSMLNVLVLFLCWFRSFWITIWIFVGACVRRIAELVVLMCWLLVLLVCMVLMWIFFFLMFIFIFFVCGSIVMDVVFVCILFCVFVSGTRCTRWTSDLNFNFLNMFLFRILVFVFWMFLLLVLFMFNVLNF